MIALEERLLKLIERQEDMLGNVDRAYTATLHVSPDGTGADGLSWRTAYTTLNLALDACSTDANDLTLILIAPGTYDMNESGIPTWAANVVLQGTHRGFTTITNSNATQSAILELDGYAVIRDMRFTQTEYDSPCNGVILNGDDSRVYRCEFDGSNLDTAAGISLMVDSERIKVIDCDFYGNTTYTMALQISNANGNFERLRIHNCLRGIWIIDAPSDHNLFSFIDIGECALGIDIDAGDEQFFYEISFHHNTRNVDDESANHIWINIYGLFPIYVLPDNFAGVTVTTGVANVYGGDTQLIAANAIDNPFRIVGTHLEPAASEWYKVRFTGDSGAIYHDEIMFDGTKREGIAAPSGTEFIFNADSRISCSAKSETGTNNVQVWVEIQEI